MLHWIAAPKINHFYVLSFVFCLSGLIIMLSLHGWKSSDSLLNLITCCHNSVYQWYMKLWCIHKFCKMTRIMNKSSLLNKLPNTNISILISMYLWITSIKYIVHFPSHLLNAFPNFLGEIHKFTYYLCWLARIWLRQEASTSSLKPWKCIDKKANLLIFTKI